MKLELKHIAPYLAHGLKVFVEDYGVELVIGIHGDELITTEDNATLDICKPLLMPLSALTEPLPDGSIPIVELGKMCYSKLKWNVILKNNKCYIGDLFKEDSYEFNYSTQDQSFWCISTNRVEPKFVPYQLQLFEYLYSIHFDIYGLIDAGLAIDKRTLNYKL